MRSAIYVSLAFLGLGSLSEAFLLPSQRLGAPMQVRPPRVTMVLYIWT